MGIRDFAQAMQMVGRVDGHQGVLPDNRLPRLAMRHIDSAPAYVATSRVDPMPWRDGKADNHLPVYETPVNTVILDAPSEFHRCGYDCLTIAARLARLAARIAELAPPRDDCNFIVVLERYSMQPKAKARAHRERQGHRATVLLRPEPLEWPAAAKKPILDFVLGLRREETAAADRDAAFFQLLALYHTEMMSLLCSELVARLKPLACRVYLVADPLWLGGPAEMADSFYDVKSDKYVSSGLAPYGEAEVMACYLARTLLLAKPRQRIAVVSHDYDVLAIMMLMAADPHLMEAVLKGGDSDLLFVVNGTQQHMNSYVISLTGLWIFGSTTGGRLKLQASYSPEHAAAARDYYLNVVFLVATLLESDFVKRTDFVGDQLYGIGLQKWPAILRLLEDTKRFGGGAVWSPPEEPVPTTTAGIFNISVFHRLRRKVIDCCQTKNVRFPTLDNAGFNRVLWVLLYWSFTSASVGGPSLELCGVRDA